MAKIQTVQQTESKQNLLAEQLKGFWAEDTWDALHCPSGPVDNLKYKTRYLSFDSLHSMLRSELKYACWQKVERREWKAATLWQTSTGVNRIVSWLAVVGEVNSLLDRSLERWELSFCTYMVDQGLWREKVHEQLNQRQEMQVYRQTNPALASFRQLYKIVQQFYDDRPEYDKEIWDLRKLGAKVNPSRTNHTVNFTRISQQWLKDAAKQFLRYTLSVYSASEGINRLLSLKRFSTFLSRDYPLLEPSQVDRPLVLAYASYLVALSLPNNARIKCLSHLRTFLELCARERWLNVPDKRLIYSEDFPQSDKAQPRFVPEEVMRQLNEHLEDLPADIRRMVLILQEAGMRIGELCRMPFDCLLQDAQGDFFLRYYQYKMKKEHSVPISREVAAVVQEQQQAARAEFESPVFLFYAPMGRRKGLPMKQERFARALNELGYEKRICDNSGTLWRFQAHQFRHTVGTRMVNLGVPQHIIQRYLGHESPGMTSTYAHIHDQTLKEEFAKFKHKVVDVTGRTVMPKDVSVESPELQWFKRNVLAQALPNGSCALPIVVGECPHANACLTCTHFRTDERFLSEHKKQVKQTEQLLEVANANGWARQVEMNQKVKDNLTRIINALEEDGDEGSA